MSVYKHTNTNNTERFSWESSVLVAAHPSMSLMRFCADESAATFQDAVYTHFSCFLLKILLWDHISWDRRSWNVFHVQHSHCACCTSEHVRKSAHTRTHACTESSCLRFSLTSLSFLARVTLIKTNTVKCEVVNAASVSNIAINNTTRGRSMGGANGMSQVILANPKPPQDISQAEGLRPCCPCLPMGENTAGTRERNLS